VAFNFNEAIGGKDTTVLIVDALNLAFSLETPRQNRFSRAVCRNS